MSDLAIAGNLFFDMSLHLDTDNIQQNLKNGELALGGKTGTLEAFKEKCIAFIDQCFCHGNRAKAIVSLNTIFDKSSSTLEKNQAIEMLNTLIADGYQGTITGGRDPKNATQYIAQIDNGSITIPCKSDLGRITALNSGLSKASQLTDITAEELKKDFKSLATGSGALRSILTSAKFFNQVFKDFDLGGEQPDLKIKMNDVLNTNIQGHLFNQWGDNSKGVSMFIESATTEQLDIAATQLRELSHAILAINEQTQQRYIFPSDVSPTILPTDIHKSAAVTNATPLLNEGSISENEDSMVTTHKLPPNRFLSLA